MFSTLLAASSGPFSGCSRLLWLLTRSTVLEAFLFSVAFRLPALLALAVLPPPLRDEVDELDLGEKDETLLALPKLVFSLQLASTFPVDPAAGNPAKGRRAAAPDFGS